MLLQQRHRSAQLLLAAEEHTRLRVEFDSHGVVPAPRCRRLQGVPLAPQAVERQGQLLQRLPSKPVGAAAGAGERRRRPPPRPPPPHPPFKEGIPTPSPPAAAPHRSPTNARAPD